jgi:biopolymer transport protein ExbB
MRQKSSFLVLAWSVVFATTLQLMAPCSAQTTVLPAPNAASASNSQTQSPASTEFPTTPLAVGTAPSMPQDLSPWGMFKSADIVVKLIMVGLAFASLLTWTIAIAKAAELRSAALAMRRDLVALAGAGSIADAKDHLTQDQGAWSLVNAAAAEMQASADTHNDEGLKERLVSRLQRLESGAGRAMMRGTGLLATIGATAPFVGLFGTVWGIMNSFINISKLRTTNLAIVAPGIAEALLATAMGLVVAIPAVVIYNAFSRVIAAHRAITADASAAVLRLTSRELDRAAAVTSAVSQGTAAPRHRVHS